LGVSPRRAFATVSEEVFHERADDLLDALEEQLDPVVEDDDAAEDLSYAQGVLTLDLGAERGSWVLNKQAPNAQIWWSSPLSGPRRYRYDEDAQAWLYTRDESVELKSALAEELSSIYGKTITLT